MRQEEPFGVSQSREMARKADCIAQWYGTPRYPAQYTKSLEDLKVHAERLGELRIGSATVWRHRQHLGSYTRSRSHGFGRSVRLCMVSYHIQLIDNECGLDFNLCLAFELCKHSWIPAGNNRPVQVVGRAGICPPSRRCSGLLLGLEKEIPDSLHSEL